MTYEECIQQYNPLTLNNILEIARERVPDYYKGMPWRYPGLNHGTAILESDEQLACYLASYGEMHRAKLLCAIKKFPFADIDSDFEIIDWGCGQGIGAVCIIDALREKGLDKALKKVTLIEPSHAALTRASQNVKNACGEETEIESRQNYLPSVCGFSQSDELDNLHIEENICIHIFSNILDIGAIDLKKLATIVGATGFKHYFICVGPLNFGNDRIPAFARYFEIDGNNVFADVRVAQYGQLANGYWYGCLAKGFKVVREDGKPFLVPMSFYPAKQFHASYRLDEIAEVEKKEPELKQNWDLISSFEVLAPFDIGASIYEDIDPVTAVLNNVVTRGLPTKCSPFIEDEINQAFSIGIKTEKYGTITYLATNENAVSDNFNLFRDITVGIARIQKTIIEAALTGRISLQDDKWEVLVKEKDVPCASLAFRDLSMLYNHLTSISRDYRDRKFPQVTLHIISSDYADSQLHGNAKVYRKPKQVDKSRVFDMVIDISMSETTDEANVQFSEFKAKNDCYFNIRSSVAENSERDIYTSERITYSPITLRDESGNWQPIPEMQEHLEYLLQVLFRKQSFRPGQLPILNRALQNKNVIGLLPTGGGKSLTYQLAAMLQPGVTLIIDPLKSLMLDQYDGLLSNGIDCCTFINSDLTPEERGRAELMMESSRALLVFMSPERLCIYPFRERLQNMHKLGVYFAYGVIDEVHCVSEWGQDFRFSYLHLGRNLFTYVHSKTGHIALFGLTATASFDVLSDVERELSGNEAFELDPETTVRYENSNRLELQYKIERIEIEYAPDRFWKEPLGWNGHPAPVNFSDNWSVQRQKAEFLKNYLALIPQYIRELQSDDSLLRITSRFEERESLENLEGSALKVDMPNNFFAAQDCYNQAGIVFCPHVNSTGISVSYNADNLKDTLEVGTFSGSPIDGKKQDNMSMENMKKFRNNELPLMVATKAFGMGIDKPNVRFTVNMNYSSSLENFIQEAGRAGRDRKMALAVILMSDYHLARINMNCTNCKYPVPYIKSYYNPKTNFIKSNWFREDDLKKILKDFGAIVDPRYIDICNPLSDIVRLKCNTDNIQRKEDGTPILTSKGKEKKAMWNCNPSCSKYAQCQLRLVAPNMRDWMYKKDLEEYLNLNKIHITKDCIEYQGVDYSTVMHFFDNNFKGELEEKRKMHELLSEKEMSYFIGNDKQYKVALPVKGFMNIVLNSTPGTEVVVLLSYDDDSYADIQKAIYRMCIIGLIDDFTQDYNRRQFRILLTRKKNGEYYERLKDFLMRYYSEEGAENEVEKASVRKGKNEIHKCLGYLTEFVYDKVVKKRKRAIDDMRQFCLIGINSSKDWKEINEDLKDEIYFYFNSKYAREGYKTESGEPFSLLDDTERSKISSFNLLFKYMRVVDDDVMGVSGSPKDNIKHLHGAVRLIRRSETETNPTLSLLNVFCLLALKVGSDQAMRNDLEASFIEGYQEFKKRTADVEEFLKGIDRFLSELNVKGRDIASEEDLKQLRNLQLIAEIGLHEPWTSDFTNAFTK